MKMTDIAAELRSHCLKKGHLSPKAVREKLQKLKKVILENEAKISEALKQDLGKSSFETYATETGFILDEIGYVLKNLDQWMKPRKVKTPLTLFPGKSLILPEPYGVVLIISPWNYPFQLCLSPLIGAVAARNRVVLKPSEFSPATSQIITEIISAVFSEDEVVVVNGGKEETEILLKQQFDYIFFTGSTNVGKIVMKAAAEHLTPLTLELGGKSPLLIEESADLDLVAKRCVWGKFLNAGQTCVAPDYVLVPERLQDTLIEKLKNTLETFYGKNIQKSPDFPRIISTQHLDRLTKLINEKKVVYGNLSSREEKYLSPTIMKDVSWDDEIMAEEIFGPVLPLIPYKDLNQELEKILSRPKPLAFYLFTKNETIKNHVLGRVSFGGGCVNDTVLHLGNPELPFGGVGPSGIGSYHGMKSFETFTHYKSVLEKSTKVDIPLRYPPYEGKLRWLKFFIR